MGGHAVTGADLEGIHAIVFAGQVVFQPYLLPGMGFGPGYVLAVNSWSTSWGINGAFKALSRLKSC